MRNNPSPPHRGPDTPPPSSELGCALAQAMAQALASEPGLDLGDEREVVAVLRAERFGEGALRAFLTPAIERARALVAQSHERAS